MSPTWGLWKRKAIDALVPGLTPPGSMISPHFGGSERQEANRPVAEEACRSRTFLLVLPTRPVLPPLSRDSPG